MSLSPRERSAAHQIASLLLAYPDEEWVARLPFLRDVARRIPGKSGSELLHFIDDAAARPFEQLLTDYVTTFDFNRRCSLYLSYFSYGETRKRGPALVRFAQAYRTLGFAPPAEELPDHLAVVLEFSARTGGSGADELFEEHRAGIELLRLALRDADSRYSRVLEAVCATLPGPSARDEREALRLLAEGPAMEEVGLEPFGLVTEGRR
jgi:nitrate reductase delta subunit